MKSKTVGLLKSAWDDWEALISTVSFSDLVRKDPGTSAVGWTLAHVSNQLDGWINVRFQQCLADDAIGSAEYSIGGSGESPNGEALLAAVEGIRRRALDFLKNRNEDELDVAIPYDGSIEHLRESGLLLRHAILRIAAHHYLHLGEAGNELARRGVSLPDLPGRMTPTL